ncbi:MAG TPA: hypothetical protein VNC84_04160 [Gammaproteobacteria bacterium]|nr:hypothetical protein [Gammaproteobacteria bacterium]
MAATRDSRDLSNQGDGAGADTPVRNLLELPEDMLWLIWEYVFPLDSYNMIKSVSTESTDFSESADFAFELLDNMHFQDASRYLQSCQRVRSLHKEQFTDLNERIKPLLSPIVSALLRIAADGRLHGVDNLLRRRPGLVYTKSNATIQDHIGRYICDGNNPKTVLQVAWACRDFSPRPETQPEMVECIEAYIGQTTSQHPGRKEQEIALQRAEQFPEGWEVREKQRRAKNRIELQEVFAAIGRSKRDSDCTAAIERFTRHITSQNKIKTGYYWDEAFLPMALDVYAEHFLAFGNSHSSRRNKLAAVKVIGGIQRRMPACLKMKYAISNARIPENAFLPNRLAPPPAGTQLYRNTFFDPTVGDTTLVYNNTNTDTQMYAPLDSRGVGSMITEAPIYQVPAKLLEAKNASRITPKYVNVGRRSRLRELWLYNNAFDLDKMHPSEFFHCYPEVLGLSFEDMDNTTQDRIQDAHDQKIAENKQELVEGGRVLGGDWTYEARNAKFEKAYETLINPTDRAVYEYVIKASPFKRAVFLVPNMYMRWGNFLKNGFRFTTLDTFEKADIERRSMRITSAVAYPAIRALASLFVSGKQNPSPSDRAKLFGNIASCLVYPLLMPFTLAADILLDLVFPMIVLALSLPVCVLFIVSMTYVLVLGSLLSLIPPIGFWIGREMELPSFRQDMRFLTFCSGPFIGQSITLLIWAIGFAVLAPLALAVLTPIAFIVEFAIGLKNLCIDLFHPERVNDRFTLTSSLLAIAINNNVLRYQRMVATLSHTKANTDLSFIWPVVLIPLAAIVGGLAIGLLIALIPGFLPGINAGIALIEAIFGLTLTTTTFPVLMSVMSTLLTLGLGEMTYFASTLLDRKIKTKTSTVQPENAEGEQDTFHIRHPKTTPLRANSVLAGRKSTPGSKLRVPHSFSTPNRAA